MLLIITAIDHDEVATIISVKKYVEFSWLIKSRQYSDWMLLPVKLFTYTGRYTLVHVWSSNLQRISFSYTICNSCTTAILFEGLDIEVKNCSAQDLQLYIQFTTIDYQTEICHSRRNQELGGLNDFILHEEERSPYLQSTC